MNLRRLLPPGAIFGTISLLLAGTPVSPGAPARSTAKPAATSASPTVKPAVTFTTNDTTSTTAATVPVGFTTVTVTPAADTNTPSSQVLSVPFYQAAMYAAAVTSVDSSTQFSSSAATWTTNQFAMTGAPYLAHFKSGNSVGRYFLIQSNTATQITVYPRGYDLTMVAAAADTFEIVPANTLGSLFGTSTVPFQTGSTATSADDLYLWNGSGFDVYYNNGTNWLGAGFLGNRNSTIIYPDEGIFLLRRSTAALSLTFFGTVPSTTERSDVTGPASTFVSNRFPTDTTLVVMGFQNLANWQNGSTANTADNVYIWNGASWDVYFYNGSNWNAAGFLGNRNATVIPTGSAVFVVRQSSVTGTAAALVQALPYAL